MMSRVPGLDAVLVYLIKIIAPSIINDALRVTLVAEHCCSIVTYSRDRSELAYLSLDRIWYLGLHVQILPRLRPRSYKRIFQIGYHAYLYLIVVFSFTC